MSTKRLFVAVAALAVALSSTGCTTGAFCFRDCEGEVEAEPDSGGGGAPDAAQLDVGAPDSQGGCVINCGDSAAADACTPTNGGIEVCDGIDNDCNGEIDEEGAQIDFSNPATCGTCDNNCTKKIANAEEATCTPTVKGQPGVCGYKSCSADHYDLNADKADGCEYFCIKTSVNGQPATDEKDPTTICNGKDDDCDGRVDEEADLCGDVNNCGKCGRVCVVPNGTPACEHTGGGASCDESNTGCKIAKCDPGYSDADGNYANGCEYRCTPTNGGVEICDGIDNDCDGLIDQFDSSLTDTRVGVKCFGGDEGLCADPAHAGTTVCHNGAVACEGADVLKPGQLTETCNLVDDDCNGLVDDNPTGQDTPCGSNTGECSAGLNKCQNGQLVCVGAKGPTLELCNGKDDDCNGDTDDNPTDATGPCGTDKGICKPGVKACQGGQVVCVGAVLAEIEICDGKDNDCDGEVDNGVDGEGDACGTDVGECTSGKKHCDKGVFVCQGEKKPSSEVCDGLDNDCNGTVDDNPQGQNAPCGSREGICRQGLEKCVNAQFECVGEVKGSAEVCDGLDNDCDGQVDEGVLPGVGGDCGNSKGECKPGAWTCSKGQIICVGGTQPTTEICDGKDNDCDGLTDNNAQGVNVPCGSSKGECKSGLTTCTSGKIVCAGEVTGSAEVCDGRDNDCNGLIDDDVPGMGGACDVPKTPPPGITSPCKAGTLTCTGGREVCQGSTLPTAAADKCNEDSNCDGRYDGPTAEQLQNDVRNCGACGNDCTTKGGHAIWGCSVGQCVKTTCEAGYYDNDGNPNDCEYACTFKSAIEQCNGVDDNCDGNIDEMKDGQHPSGVIAPTAAQVCGVSPGATEAGCTTGVTVKCQSGAWKCTFPAGYCDKGSPASCAATPDICDGYDNNCNGASDEPYRHPIRSSAALGDACASDDATPGSQGVCRTTGTYVCNGTTATKCNATMNANEKSDEKCDGLDNDCDGSIDETFNKPGSDARFVVPAVTKLANNLWIYQYEASRPSATTISSGSGNGYYCTGSGCASGIPKAPAGTPLDKTPACSVGGKVPWFNVTPIEGEQTCNAMGGRLCTTTDWQTACRARVNPNNCTWGYAPNGTACRSAYTSSKFCNLGMSFDFDGNAGNGIQDGLLPGGSSSLLSCYADWTTLQGNGTAGRLYDITGNLREITKKATNQYPLMGGAFNTQSEAGATCEFTFYTVDQNFALYDAGFRCCFDADPR